MKRWIIIFFLIPMYAIAGWEVVKPETAAPRGPFFQSGVRKVKILPPTTFSATSFPNQHAVLGQPAARYAISISGSLKENIERIMGRYHWKVIWKSQHDFNFDGRVTGTSLPNVIEKLLKPFPLKADMYMGNRKLVVANRYIETKDA